MKCPRQLRTSVLFALRTMPTSIPTRAHLSTELFPTLWLKVVTSPMATAQVASQSMELNSLMRTLTLGTTSVVSSQWQMLAPAPTVPSSLSHSWKLHGSMETTLSLAKCALTQATCSANSKLPVPALARPRPPTASLTAVRSRPNEHKEIAPYLLEKKKIQIWVSKGRE